MVKSDCGLEMRLSVGRMGLDGLALRLYRNTSIVWDIVQGVFLHCSAMKVLKSWD